MSFVKLFGILFPSIIFYYAFWPIIHTIISDYRFNKYSNKTKKQIRGKKITPANSDLIKLEENLRNESFNFETLNRDINQILANHRLNKLSNDTDIQIAGKSRTIEILNTAQLAERILNKKNSLITFNANPFIYKPDEQLCFFDKKEYDLLKDIKVRGRIDLTSFKSNLHGCGAVIKTTRKEANIAANFMTTYTY